MNIEFYPDSRFLLTLATPVTEFNKELAVLGHRMIETMLLNDGLGLAGNQVGVLKRIIVVSNNDDVEVMINPEFQVNPKVYFKHGAVGRSTSGTLEDFFGYPDRERGTWAEEGCLSIPGVYGSVWRWSGIKVKYQDINGNYYEKETSGSEARIIQHEIDHLDGILFPQRIHFQKTGKWIELRNYSTIERWRLDEP